MPLSELMREHRLIERVLAALEAFAETLEAGDPVEPAELSDFVEFARDYADRRHHAKEEDVLFAAMAAAGCPRHTGPIALMLEEHERGRDLVSRLGEYIRPVADWDGAQRGAMATLARDFVTLLRSHIEKEDRIVFPMAVQGLDGAAMAEVARRFAALDREARELGEKTRLERLAERLVAAYGSRGAEPDSPSAAAPGSC